MTKRDTSRPSLSRRGALKTLGATGLAATAPFGPVGLCAGAILRPDTHRLSSPPHRHRGRLWPLV